MVYVIFGVLQHASTFILLLLADKQEPSCLFDWISLSFVVRSPTGKYLALSSQDGYCSLVEFVDDELGSPICLSGIFKFILYLSYF